MDKEEIHRLWDSVVGIGVLTTTMIEEFAAFVAAAEREACADLCEGHYDTKQAARAIRARSE